MASYRGFDPRVKRGKIGVAVGTRPYQVSRGPRPSLVAIIKPCLPVAALARGQQPLDVVRIGHGTHHGTSEVQGVRLVVAHAAYIPTSASSGRRRRIS